ncbi:unnamed protein product [Clonostachys byssicola]|uniref:Protein kinase domain-containing protein n=1 Tax=Clonostachys byssicola TaxID=160290 RepID=A0A9N9UL30_9HYPO|nr:unnamed protein product [Clonostachys byssicola]
MPIDNHKPKAQYEVEYERSQVATKPRRTSVPLPDRTRPRSSSKFKKSLKTIESSALQIPRLEEPSRRANADQENILSSRPHAEASSEHQKTEQANKPHVVEESQARPHARDPPISIARDVSSSLRNNDLVQDSKLDTALIDHDGNSVQHTLYISSHRSRRRPRKVEETWKRSRKIGSGTFGNVWLQECVDGKNENIGRLRAVKVIAKTKCGDGSAPIEYNRELEAIAKFSQSKYVHCFAESYGWYENNDTIFITMEYFENGDLRRYLNHPFPEPQAKEIVYQILEGLRFMHKSSFAHRDLKPANILVSEASPNWWVKISDFGISKRAEQESTAFRTFAGTRGYLAPEVMAIYPPDEKPREKGSRRKEIYTNAVDLWALGVIMFQLLTTQLIMKDPHELWEYVNGNQALPEEVLDKNYVSDAAKTLVKRLMAPSPGRRPSASVALNYEWFTDLDDSSESKLTNEQFRFYGHRKPSMAAIVLGNMIIENHRS